jgi:transposase-like protein
MGRKAYTPEFKAQVTKEAIETNNTVLVASKHGLSQSTVYNWFSKEVNKESTTKKKDFKTLQKKCQELELENRILKELLKKTWLLFCFQRTMKFLPSIYPNYLIAALRDA